jgi:hypothetical protein
MPYREPKLQIFQDFEAALAGGVQPLHACYIGPNFALHRFSEDAEKAKMGTYDESLPSTVFAWPDHVAGGDIDLASAKIINEDTYVRYYQQDIDGQLTVDGNNRLNSTLGSVPTSTIFKTNAAALRDAAFGTRDVQVGDTARLTYLNPDTSMIEQFTTLIAGFEADVVAGTTTPTLNRVIGFGDTSVSATESVANPAPTAYTVTYDASAYDGLADGYPLDTYTIRVLAIGAGAASDELDGTVLEISSDGGEAPVQVTLGTLNDIVPAGGPPGVYTVPLGTRGATFDINDAGSGTVSLNDYWQVTVAMTYTEIDVAAPAEITVGGPYTGAINTQYILTVTQGGEVDTDEITLSFSTNNGADISGTISVPASTGASLTIPFGNLGMDITVFATTQYNTGDVITFDVTGESDGPIYTLIFRDNIPLDSGVDIDLELGTIETIEMSPLYYTLTQNDITVLGGATHSSDILGSASDLDIFGGSLFADYREQRTDDCDQLGFIDSISAIVDTLGPISELNPLAKAVNHGLENSAGVGAYYIAVCADTLAGYSAALEVTTENDAVYSMVPLTHDQEIKDLIAAHVVERSSAINNQWRIAWVTNDAPEIKEIYTELSAATDILATVSELSPSQYRQVDAAGALFLTNDVEPGDTMRINFSTDPITGVVSYDEFVVDRVESETQLIILGTLPAAITVPIKIEIWRDQSNIEFAQSLSEDSAQYNSRRVYNVWADNPVESDGSSMDMIYVASALAGQRSGVAPHAPLSNVNVAGILLDPVQGFGRTNYNTIASGGVWLVTKDFEANVFTRHQISTFTNPDDLEQREQSVTTNLDDISRTFFNNTKDLYGQGNVSPAMVELIGQRVDSLISQISNRPYPAKIGPQMLDAEVISLQVDNVLRDTINVEIDPALPVPLNVLNIRFTINPTA